MISMTHSLTRWTTTLALAAWMCGAAQASEVLYEQAPRVNGDLYLSTPTNQNAESFQLGGAATVSAIRWYGTAAAMDSFSVRFFGDLAGNPDGFNTQSGVQGSTLTRSTDPVQTIQKGQFNFEIFEYELSLASPYPTAANQPVYVSIFSDEPEWGWLDSADGDGVSAFRGADREPWNFAPPDLSLTVLGDRTPTGVPEPVSMALFGLALAAAASARRRTA